MPRQIDPRDRGAGCRRRPDRPPHGAGLIQGAGIKCRLACDGNEALQAIRDCRPAAAILDVNMPGIDGYEVLAAIRQEAFRCASSCSPRVSRKPT